MFLSVRSHPQSLSQQLETKTLNCSVLKFSLKPLILYNQSFLITTLEKIFKATMRLGVAFFIKKKLFCTVEIYLILSTYFKIIFNFTFDHEERVYTFS